MSDFSQELQLAAAFNYPESIDSFRKKIPLEWIADAVQQTGWPPFANADFPLNRQFGLSSVLSGECRVNLL